MDLAAVGEQGGEARAQVEAATIELSQVNDEMAGGLPLPRREGLHLGHQVGGAEVGWGHRSVAVADSSRDESAVRQRPS